MTSSATMIPDPSPDCDARTRCRIMGRILHKPVPVGRSGRFGGRLQGRGPRLGLGVSRRLAVGIGVVSLACPEDWICPSRTTTDRRGDRATRISRSAHTRSICSGAPCPGTRWMTGFRPKPSSRRPRHASTKKLRRDRDWRPPGAAAQSQWRAARGDYADATDAPTITIMRLRVRMGVRSSEPGARTRSTVTLPACNQRPPCNSRPHGRTRSKALWTRPRGGRRRDRTEAGRAAAWACARRAGAARSPRRRGVRPRRHLHPLRRTAGRGADRR